MIGVFPGKFLPPHRGHLNAIIKAATEADILYVVVSDNPDMTTEFCKDAGLDRTMDGMLRARWLARELSGFDHVHVMLLDETGIPSYPNGADQWSKALLNLIPQKIDVIYGGEPEYKDVYMRHLPGIEYRLYDPDRKMVPISGTKIRNAVYDNWDMILGSARGFFAKRVLITGTESCGKTTLTKYLAKLFYTSWSEEFGRYYAQLHMGGNESLFVQDDFVRIAEQQREQDEDALSKANRVCFFDTDAVVTQFYSEIYLGENDHRIEKFFDPNFYDLVLFMLPTVKWVSDGQRFISNQFDRDRNSKRLIEMYFQAGFKNIQVISDDSYSARLELAVSCVRELIGAN